MKIKRQTKFSTIILEIIWHHKLFAYFYMLFDNKLLDPFMKNRIWNNRVLVWHFWGYLGIFNDNWIWLGPYFISDENSYRLIFVRSSYFLHQLTHNMKADCSLNYKFNTWKFQAQNMGRTCCVHKLFLIFRTISVHNMFYPCSPKKRASDKDLPVQRNFKSMLKPQRVWF